MSKICPSCGNKNGNKDLFCKKCGTDISSGGSVKSKVNKKVVAIVTSIVIIAVIIVIGISMYFFNPIIRLERSIDNMNEEDALEIYSQILGFDGRYDNYLADMTSRKIEEIKQNFIDKNETYDSAMKKLEILRYIKVPVDDIDKYIRDLNDSRNSYEKAQEEKDNEDYVAAMSDLQDVISDDSNYDSAKSMIQEIKNDYKNQVMAECQSLLNENKNEEALRVLNDAKDILKDYDLEMKITEVTERVEDEKASKAYKASKEEISVEDVSFTSISGQRAIESIIKNGTQKIINSYVIVFSCYDVHGNLLKINTKGYLEGEDEHFNIKPGCSAGAGYCWRVTGADNACKIFACVKSATFTDGTTWKNPYYDYWFEYYQRETLGV